MVLPCSYRRCSSRLTYLFWANFTTVNLFSPPPTLYFPRLPFFHLCQGEFKTTNPMFLGRDTGSSGSPSPQPAAEATATVVSPIYGGAAMPFPSSGGGGGSLASNNPLLGLGSSSSSLSASAAAGAGGAVRRGAAFGPRSPPTAGQLAGATTSPKVG